jgi:hypothetical protein
MCKNTKIISQIFSFIEAIIPAKGYKSCGSGGSQEIKERSDADSVEETASLYAS